MIDFEVLVCCYGDYLDISKRCIDSILQYKSFDNLKIHIGLSDCSSLTKNYFRQLLDNSKITTLIESNININKDPMMRLLLDLVDSKYMVWFDDDSYIVKNNWDKNLQDQIAQNNVDILGFPYVVGYNQQYMSFLRTRRWWKNKIRTNDPNICHFPVGGLWAAKCEYLRKYNYPDRNMIKKHDDMLLGDLLFQTNGSFDTMYGWNDTFMVNKNDRRGDREDGWKNFH